MLLEGGGASSRGVPSIVLFLREPVDVTDDDELTDVVRCFSLGLIRVVVEETEAELFVAVGGILFL